MLTLGKAVVTTRSRKTSSPYGMATRKPGHPGRNVERVSGEWGGPERDWGGGRCWLGRGQRGAKTRSTAFSALPFEQSFS